MRGSGGLAGWVRLTGFVIHIKFTASARALAVNTAMAAFANFTFKADARHVLLIGAFHRGVHRRDHNDFIAGNGKRTVSKTSGNFSGIKRNSKMIATRTAAGANMGIVIGHIDKNSAVFLRYFNLLVLAVHGGFIRV